MNWIKRKPKLELSKNDDTITKIAKIRGIKEEDITDFLNPSEDELFSPSELMNVNKARKRIIQAIENNENVVISYDPDADGITSGTLLVRYFRHYLEEDKINYIYSQREDGHSVLEQLVEVFGDSEEAEKRRKLNAENLLKVSKADLVIIADSSSNDVEGCEMIKDYSKADIIVIDHHEVSNGGVSDLAILVNPQQEGDEYPNKHLSGCGVVFKVLQRVEEKMKKVNLDQYYDLVAVGALADMMDMTIMENRYMVMHGLKNMNNMGLIRIIKSAKKNPDFLRGDDVGFTIAPLINGSARMGQIELPIQLLLSDEDKEVKSIRLKMNKLNEQRKQIQAELTTKYEKEVNINDKVIIISDTEGNKGFNGLVAQNIAQKFQRPTFIVREFNGMMAGSGRSFGGVNTQELLEPLDYVKTQGHAQSHGIDFPADKLNDLRDYLNKNMPDLKSKEPIVMYDFEIEADKAYDYTEDIDAFNYITGQGFPKVAVRINDVMVEGRRVMGERKNTIKFTTISGESNLELIKFMVDEEYMSHIGFFDTVSAVGVLSMNVFYNFATKVTTRTPQLNITDIQ